MDKGDRLLASLAATAVRRKAAQAESAKEMARARELANDAYAAGVPITAIARAAGLARLTIYRLLGLR